MYDPMTPTHWGWTTLAWLVIVGAGLGLWFVIDTATRKYMEDKQLICHLPILTKENYAEQKLAEYNCIFVLRDAK